VIASARKIDSPELVKLSGEYPSDRLALVQLDVVDPESLAKAAAKAEELLPNGLDYLISNAGVNSQPDAIFLNLYVLATSVTSGTLAKLFPVTTLSWTRSCTLA